MKRFLVFGGDKYYAGGGWSDFRYDCDELSQVVWPSRETAYSDDPVECEWYHVVDTQTGVIVAQGGEWMGM